MITINIKFFGSFTLLTGLRQMSFVSDSSLTVKDFIAKLIDLYPKLSEILLDDWRNEPDLYLIVIRKGKVLISDTLLDDGDEITVVTPTSGG